MTKINGLLTKIVCVAIFSITLFAKDTLYVGTNAEFAPFEYLEYNKIVGFDIELIKEIGNIIDKDIKVKNISFDGLLPALEAKKIDIIIAGMTITEDRKKFVDFSDTYFSAKQVIILKKDVNNINSLNDLVDKKTGVILGYTGDLIVSKIKGINKEQYNSTSGGIIALLSGKIDAFVLDSAPSKNYIKKNKNLKIIELDIAEENYAIAIRKNQGNLVFQINLALKKLKSNGVYDKLLEKYFK